MFWKNVLGTSVHVNIINRRVNSFISQNYSSTAMDLTNGETRIKAILEKEFPKASAIQVKDVSGGCGSMYAIDIRAGEFKDLTVVNQHRLVHKVLKDEIQGMHGLQLKTSST